MMKEGVFVFFNKCKRIMAILATAALILPNVPSFASEYDTFQTGNFYYTCDGDCVTVSLCDKLMNYGTDTEFILAFYDNGALLKTEIISIDGKIISFGMKDFTVDLPVVPENLTVKSFMWSADGDCMPLDNVSELSNIPDNAIECYGRVVATNRTTYGLAADEVTFIVEKADDFNGIKIDYSYQTLQEDMKNIKTDIDEHLFEYVKAYVLYNSATSEYEIIDYSTEGIADYRTRTKSFPLSDAKIENDGAYINGYPISRECYFFVNGVECMYSELMNLVNSNMYPNAVLKITDSELGNRSYDHVMIENYAMATIDSVQSDNGVTTVYFEDSSVGCHKFEIDESDEDIVIEIKDKNGVKLGKSGLNELVKGDTVYIAYNYYDGLEYSMFYDIIVDKEISITKEEIPEFSFDSVRSTMYVHKTDGTNMLSGDLLINYSGKGQKNKVSVDFYNGTELTGTKEFDLAENINSVSLEMADCGDFEADLAVLNISGNGEVYFTADIPIIEADEVTCIKGRVVGTYKNYNIEPYEAMVCIEYEPYDTYIRQFRTNIDIDTLYEYSEIFIADNEEVFQIVPIKPENKVSFITSDITDIMIDDWRGIITVEKDGKQTEYRLEKQETIMYINGLECWFDEMMAQQYLLNNPGMKVTLLDTTLDASTASDGKFDRIFVDYYCTAVVDSVTETDDGVNISFKAASEPVMEISLPAEEGVTYYSITKDGKEIPYTDIKQGDILSIAYDVTNGLEYSLFKDIIVSSDCFSGVVEAYDSQKMTVTINNNEYTVNNYIAIDEFLGSEVKAYVDAFGTLAYLEETFVPDDNEMEEDLLG